MNPSKGPDQFVRMAATVGRIAPRTVFCLAGSSDNERYFSKVKTMAREKAKGVPVRFLGFWKEINHLLPALDLVVIPSTVPEGCPRVALEAMAFGKPVVAYRVGGLAEMVRHGVTGYLVPLKDPGALAQRVLALVRDGNKRAKFGQEARRVVETRYHVKDYEKIIKSIFL